MAECIHHWTIARAEGPTSVGRCRRCKETRIFENSITASIFNNKHFLGPTEPGKKPIA